MREGDDGLPARMSFYKIANSFRRLAQWITSIDDGDDFSGFKKIFIDRTLSIFLVLYTAVTSAANDLAIWTANVPTPNESLLTMCHIMWHIVFMPSVNLRQLRDTRQLKAWLKAGETVELRERNCVLGKIIPEQPVARPVEWPDFEARARKIFGDRMIPIVEDMIEERNSRY
jgi:hypothetical protein